MKKNIVTILIAMLTMAVQAQDAKETFIKIDYNDMYTRCFLLSDYNGDGVVTYGEAVKTTSLVMDMGGVNNLIDDYSFLRFFPNLTSLSVGNTVVETLDLSYNSKLERLDLTNTMMLKNLTLDAKCNPQIIFPRNTINDITIHRIDIVAPPTGYAQCEKYEADDDVYPCYIVTNDGKKFGVYYKGHIAIPCEYSKEEVMQSWFSGERSDRIKKTSAK